MRRTACIATRSAASCSSGAALDPASRRSSCSARPTLCQRQESRIFIIELFATNASVCRTPASTRCRRPRASGIESRSSRVCRSPVGRRAAKAESPDARLDEKIGVQPVWRAPDDDLGAARAPLGRRLRSVASHRRTRRRAAASRMSCMNPMPALLDAAQRAALLSKISAVFAARQATGGDRVDVALDFVATAPPGRAPSRAQLANRMVTLRDPCRSCRSATARAAGRDEVDLALVTRRGRSSGQNASNRSSGRLSVRRGFGWKPIVARRRRALGAGAMLQHRGHAGERMFASGSGERDDTRSPSTTPVSSSVLASEVSRRPRARRRGSPPSSPLASLFSCPQVLFTRATRRTALHRAVTIPPLTRAAP